MKNGTKVSVTFEGEVSGSEIWNGSKWYRVYIDGFPSHTVVPAQLCTEIVAPWQAGDIATHRNGSIRIRQADGSWINSDGDTDCLGDSYADGNYTPVVRGGRTIYGG